MALAEWVADGEPPFDLWPVDLRRFGPNHRDPNWVRTRTMEAYRKHYTIAWPMEEYLSARPLRRSPLYDRLAARGACFGEKLGWERPNWFADTQAGERPQDHYAFTRPNWTDAVAREHQACREAAVVFDQTSFAKAMLVGRDAERALSWIAANDVARPPGRVIYTQMLNAKGGIECDLTVTRLAPDRYYIVTGTGFATHDFDWIRRNIPADCDASLLDVTSATAVLALMGPHSRAILQKITSDDLSPAAFKFATAREIAIAGAPVLALRITYVGELGWELHIPVECATTVYDALTEAGRPLGLRDGGYRAIETLRLEKAYRAWGSDIGPDHSPLMAGLGWAVKLRTPTPFLGRAALEAAPPLPRLLTGFAVATQGAVLLGRETIYRDGAQVGWLTSGGFGHTVGHAIGYGYVRNLEGLDAAWVLAGHYELEIAGQRVPAHATLEPFHDPSGHNIRT
jgi:4-methylaminobutanoate oxidase (formaldehyde-forming)